MAGPKKTKSKPKALKPKAKKAPGLSRDKLTVFERRRHPRFLLSREQFRDTRSGKVYPIFDLSLNGMSMKVDQRLWKVGQIVSGILNLHPDSIELTPRLVDYYGDRAALKFEVLSTYARSILSRALSPQRLGESLQLVKEKLPVADYWFHGVCNTDLLIRMGESGDISKVEVFFSNFYCSWAHNSTNGLTTGVCQSVGLDQREDFLLADEPVKLEGLELKLDGRVDNSKLTWARGILECAPLEPQLKEVLLLRFPKENN